MANRTWGKLNTRISLLLRSYLLKCVCTISMPLNLLLSLHDEVFEALIADFLVFCNYEVRAAYSQQDALSYCQNDNFDMAVIDIKEEKDAQFVEYLLAIKPELDILALIHEGVSNDVIKSLRLPQEQLLSLPAPLVSMSPGKMKN